MSIEAESGLEMPRKSLAAHMSDVGRLMRPMAILCLVAMVLARVIAPGLKGIAPGLGRLIDVIDVTAGISSHILALTTSAASIGVLVLIARDTRMSKAARILLVVLAALVLVLAVPASRLRLSAAACFLVGMIASLLALIASAQGIREPRSRALGFVLGAVGLASCLRIVAAGLVAFPSGDTLQRLAFPAMAIAALSMLVHSGALVLTLAWLASRRRMVVSPTTLGALAISVIVSHGASVGAQPNATPWNLFCLQASDRLISQPSPPLPLAVLCFVALLGPALALGALLTPRQVPTVTAGLAMALTAGVLLDSPAHALMMTMAALATVIASRDDRGMWETLVGRPLKESAPQQGA